MALIGRVTDLIEPLVLDLGFELVRVKMMGGRPPTLQVMAERPDGTMNVDDCTQLSHAIEKLLDERDPIPGEYTLEVSSPGIDRPLTRPKDFARYVGHEARMELREPLDGRKRFRGIIEKADATTVSLAILSGKPGEKATLELDALAEAKLVLTDKLIDESLKSKQARNAGKAGTREMETEN